MRQKGYTNIANPWFTLIILLQSGEAERRSSGLRPGRVISTCCVGAGRSLTRRVEWSRCLAVSEGAQPSIIVEFVFIIVVKLGKLLKVELVTHDSTDTTKALHELVAL
jgi:hypothetical protein